MPELGAATYFHLYRDRFGFDLEGLAAQCRAFLDSTERLYEESMDRALREHVGVGLAEAERYDIRRFFRGSSWDEAFPADRMLPALAARSPISASTSTRRRTSTSTSRSGRRRRPRAFCAPIEVPGKVMLVIQPMGGPDDWRALFHEAGHTEHFAFTSPDLKMEEKRLGDNAVTEGWAMLLEHLVDDRGWLTRMLDFPRPREFAAEGAVDLLFFVRRYCGEAALRDRVPRRRPTRRRCGPATSSCSATRSRSSRARTDYLVGHRLQLLLHVLPARLGVRGAALDASCARSSAATGSRAARPARCCSELWALGQQPTADELLKDVTGAPSSSSGRGQIRAASAA